MHSVFSIQLMRLSSCYYLQSTWWKKCIEAKTFVIGVAQVRFMVDYCVADYLKITYSSHVTSAFIQSPWNGWWSVGRRRVIFLWFSWKELPS